ncbi:MAG TPA: YceI family protein [Frankiaceae bacterium]|jgi:polyisoprenoid-binding protein YceI|nr:YceI family protein [Frankiaceae bacterium]
MSGMANALRTQEKDLRGPDALLPLAGDWSVRTGPSRVSFSGRASRIAPTVRAQFGAVRGGLHLADDPDGSRVGVCVDVRTVTTGNPIWDELLRTADPFRAAQHPLAHYASTAVRWSGSGFEVHGNLEIGGVGVALSLDARVRDNGDGTVTLRADGTIDPRAARIHLDLPGARLLMPRELRLSIAVVAGRAGSAAVPKQRFALAS